MSIGEKTVSSVLKRGFQVQKLVAKEEGTKVAQALGESSTRTIGNSAARGAELGGIAKKFGQEQAAAADQTLKAAQAALNQRVADSKAVSMEAISRARMAALAARDGVVTTAERGSAAAQAGSAWTGNKIGEGVDAAQLGSARIAFDAQAGTAHKVASIGGYLMELGKKWKPEGNRP